MNGLKVDLETIRQVSAHVNSGESAPEALLCVPATLLSAAAETARGTALAVGGQTCSKLEKGAFTGDVSAPMLAEAGATFVIVGHSERRTGHGESDAEVAGQAAAALKSGLTPIICIGETLAERDAGATLNIIDAQLNGSLEGLDSASSFVIAYEPLWAIGTGKVATTEQISEVHAFIRSFLVSRYGAAGNMVRILYGGSLNPANAPEILPVPNVDGGLIGGASLKAADFLSIYEAAHAL